MVVIIKKHDNIIPIDFGEFVLEFVVNDVNIEKMQKIAEELKIDKIKDVRELNSIHQITKKQWITLFDEETFKKILDFANGSTIDMALYLAQTIKGLSEEVQSKYNDKNFEKYL